MVVAANPGNGVCTKHDYKDILGPMPDFAKGKLDGSAARIKQLEAEVALLKEKIGA